jgi:hypothetical protein
MEYNFLTEEQITEVQAAIAEVKRAVKKRDDLIEKYFSPENTIIHWRKPMNYFQTGIVKIISGDSIRALNTRTGNLVWVDMYFVDWTAMTGSASWKEEGLPSYMQDENAEGDSNAS